MLNAAAPFHGIILRIGLDQLIGSPGDGVRLSRPCGVLNQVCLSRTFSPGVPDQLSYDIKLMVARKEQCLLCQWICFLAVEAYEMLNNVRYTFARENAFPQV